MAPRPQAGMKVEEKRSEADSRGLQVVCLSTGQRCILLYLHAACTAGRGRSAQLGWQLQPSKERGKEKNGAKELGRILPEWRLGFKAGVECRKRNYRLRPHTATSSKEARGAKASVAGSLPSTTLSSPSPPACPSAMPPHYPTPSLFLCYRKGRYGL